MYHDASTSYHCHCAAANAQAGADDESHEANCSLYKEELENFGFHVRGDAPVIIAHVEINSLADVSRVEEWSGVLLAPSNPLFSAFSSWAASRRVTSLWRLPAWMSNGIHISRLCD